MTNLEMVETLREKANVSYEEAKAALEASNWDLLDAILLLESEGKIPRETASYSTRAEELPPAEEPKEHKGFRDGMRWLGQVFRKLLHIGNTNQIVVSKNNKECFSLPVTVFVVLLLCSVWTILIAMLVSLFFGVRYAFRGPDLGKESINRVMDKAGDMAENMKEEFQKQENK